MASSSNRWNHNIHYHRVILDSVPLDCRRALDIGCGEGTLTRQLRQLIPEVLGIDEDHASITAARAHPDASDIQYIESDALTHEFEPSSFDLLTAVASLHHMEAERALVRLKGLLRPGMLAVVGLARSLIAERLAARPSRDHSEPSAATARSVLAAPIAGRMAAARELRIDAPDRDTGSTRRPLPTPALLALHTRLDQALTRFDSAMCMSPSGGRRPRFARTAGAARCYPGGGSGTGWTLRSSIPTKSEGLQV